MAVVTVQKTGTKTNSNSGDSLWQDREVRFDLSPRLLKLRSGEKLLDYLDAIEDTKGNAGDRGRMKITNLRLIWVSLSTRKISLSIGFNCILSTNTKVVTSKLKGTTNALHLLTKSQNTRFEFIFTNLVTGNTRHFTSVMAIHKAYNSSRIYRELKLRGAFIENKRLKMLPLEQVGSTETGIWNLSSDQGNLGIFIITNVRLVWFADMNENFNISLPFLQIINIRIRDSKFGKALVIESTESSGGYVLGFRVDPPEKLKAVHSQLIALHSVYGSEPIFGVQYTWQEPNREDLNQITSESNAFESEEESEDPSMVASDAALLAYFADGSDNNIDNTPVYCPTLGLAIERLRPGVTIEQLWQVLGNNK